MNNINAVAVFCEDIRQEKTGQDTLIGVMADNIGLGQVPLMLPKLCIYTRINMSADRNPKLVAMKTTLLDGKELVLGSFDEAAIEKERDAARERQAPLIGFIFRGTLTPAPVPNYGRMLVTATVGESSFLCGSLNFVPAVPQHPALERE